MNLNLKTKYIIIFTLIFFIVILLFIIFRKNNPDSVQNLLQVSPTPQEFTDPSPTPDTRKYNIVKVEPKDEAEAVSPDTNITIVFDKIPDSKLIDFSMHPQTQFQTSFYGNSLTVNPLHDLETGTQYTYIIKYNNDTLPSKTYTFTTVGEFKGPQNTEPEGAAQIEEEFQKQNHPDVFLSNKTPYTSSSFDLTSDFVGGEGGHFQFTVSQKSDSSQADFHDFSISLGLSEEQFSSLDVIYK